MGEEKNCRVKPRRGLREKEGGARVGSIELIHDSRLALSTPFFSSRSLALLSTSENFASYFFFSFRKRPASLFKGNCAAKVDDDVAFF